MRIFIDCTHTAKYTYKNTGIHRVVRELTSELLKLNSSRTDIEILLVMFDGRRIRRVTSLNPSNHGHVNKSKFSFYLNKVNSKFQILISKIINKLKKLSLEISDLIASLHNDPKNQGIYFEKYQIKPEDIYVIADANWDLPKTYYRFLQNLKQSEVTLAIICYDIIPIKFPHFSSHSFTKAFTSFYKEYSNLFDLVLCISQNSAKDYKNAKKQGILSINNPNVIVKSFRLGCDYYNHDDLVNLDNTSFDTNLHKLLTKRYILVVGSLVPHKNIKAIMEAFDLLINSNYEDIHLLFAGNRGWHPETDAIIESHQMYGKLIHILGSVTDAQLKVLYKNCYCLVQASFYEGFGLPVVEALQYFKPVVASTGGSLPEIGGDFCVYFDPNEPTELYESLKKLLDSDIYYNDLVEYIKKQYKPFSWQESAEQFLSSLCN
ncbi:glycosyltransferase family 4 protein [Chrysosporum bergii ANA360D]|uniref:Glycosyltransferase family 4 protein n=1 Tax=Chrysosporum bergii ANA360D TaxID=617107 RepID=A0AA43GQM7_9CYAN|nr:glycosyltransferase family 1 protein [Chrysosporum bergii]MDH6059541.1 glycosyltransferase family 4 protein [Chrysosporum bergii ANA360D]